MPSFSPAYGFYDVTSFGASGNGITDDSGAIFAAEQACEGTGGVVFFPPGIYLIGALKPTIPIAKSGIQWRGTGSGSSVLLAPPGRIAPTLIQAGSSSAAVQDIAIADLGFAGNGVAPTGGAVNQPVIAFGASGLQSVSSCRVIDCSFTSNTGPTVAFVGVNNGEVTRCQFESVGYHYASGYSGRAYVTPGVSVDSACVNIRIHHNEFSNCQYDGVFTLGLACEISYNHFDSCFSAAVDVGLPNQPQPVLGPGSDLSVIGNHIVSTEQVSGDAYGIVLIGVQNVQVIGNTVAKTFGHGIGLVACSNSVVIGNICYDSGQHTGGLQPDGCGIAFDGDVISQTTYIPNQSVVFVGNVCYDDQAVPTQQYGLKIYNATSQSAASFVVSGNSFWGNAVSDIFADSLFTPSSNVAIANTGVVASSSWLDRQHETSNTLTGTTAKSSLLNSPLYVGAHSLLFTRGYRLVASGVTSGSGTKNFYLGLHASGNLMTLVNQSGGSNIPWQLVAYILNDLAENSQKVMVQFWYNSALKYYTPATTSIDMTIGQQILLEGVLGVPADSISCQFVSLERI